MLGWLETRSLAARFGLAPGAVDALIDQIPRPAVAGEGRFDGDPVDAPEPVNITVEMMESQLRDAVESARKIQAPVPLGALAAQIYGMVGTGGYIDLDYSVVDQAIYAIANAEATQQQDPGQVALSVDTIQQSLDVSHT
jgi:3-hydroxyisobutyrate dehydrogenase-like beta-hydroxyacid dehydrogenase